MILRTLVLWAAPRIWHFAYGKRIPSQAKLWIYVPVIPNTHTHTPPVAVCRKKPLKNDISTGHKINSQTLSERHSQAVLLMLRTSRTKSRRNVKLGGKNTYGRFLAHKIGTRAQSNGIYGVIHKIDSRGRKCCTLTKSMLKLS